MFVWTWKILRTEFTGITVCGRDGTGSSSPLTYISQNITQCSCNSVFQVSSHTVSGPAILTRSARVGSNHRSKVQIRTSLAHVRPLIIRQHKNREESEKFLFKILGARDLVRREISGVGGYRTLRPAGRWQRFICSWHCRVSPSKVLIALGY